MTLLIRLVDPLLPLLHGCTRLFLSPDGDLHQLPFEVLPLADTRLLIDTCQISYLGSGRDVLRFNAGVRAPGFPSIVAADPDFDLGSAPGSSGAIFGRLRGTRIEGLQIASLLGVAPVMAGAVLEAPLKQDMAPGHSPVLLHLATHGFFLIDQSGTWDSSANIDLLDQMGFGLERLAERHIANPLLRSGLALTGVNTWLQRGDLPPEAEDGLLMAEDVTGLDLLDTELVVLSACDTGLGDIHAGEGVFGLRRAFVIAGAKTLVMSLWKVPDHAT